MFVFRISRVALQKKYQEKVNQCVSKLIQDKKSDLSSNVHTLIAQMLGLQIDTASKLSGLYILYVSPRVHNRELLWTLGIYMVSLLYYGLLVSLYIIIYYCVDKSFSEHGGDSLTAMRFTAVVKELFGVDINVDVLLSPDMSLDRLTDMISGHNNVVAGDKDVLDLMRQDMNINLPKCSDQAKVCATQNVFVTGVFDIHLYNMNTYDFTVS